MNDKLNLVAVLPEMFVATMACVILVVDLFAGKERRLMYGLSLATLAGAALLTMSDYATTRSVAFGGMFVEDALSDLIKIAIYVIAFGVFVYGRSYARQRDLFRGEYFVLGLFGVVGMMVMASANHFLTVYLGLELLSLCLYAMVAFQRDSALATEASMKYFVLGALASGVLLYGMSILYGLTGSLEIDAVRASVAAMPPDSVPLIFGLVFVVVGIAFKLGAVPFHMWIPDVYHGAPTSTVAYLGTAPKLAGFALVMRLLVGGLEDLHGAWRDMIIVMAVLSMVGGNVVAIAQTNIKRMLAYSTIAHMGFFLLGILSGQAAGYTAALFYVLVYAVMSLGAFGMILLLSRAGFEADALEDFRGLNQRHPWYAFLMLLFMFSMAGVPPTVGFSAKLAVIQALIAVDLVWLAVVAVLSAVVGAFYYLRVVRLMYFDRQESGTPIRAALDMRLLLGVNGLAVILIMPWVGGLFAICASAVGLLAGG